MKTSIFINLLEKKQQIQQLETAELKSVVEEFPYFQSARALYLKGLRNQNSFKYNNELKVTAAYTSDRTVLFNFITAKDFNSKKEDIHKQILEKISKKVVKENTLEITEDVVINPTETIEEVEEKLEIGKPISFLTTESNSFNQWLQLSVQKPIARTVEKIEEKTIKKASIIDTFIKNNPKIKPLSKDKNITVPVAQNTHDSALMTETLAKVYLEQKKYQNAIQAYRILSLKYPEKSGFFADQIKRVQILQKNKS
ncbi:hypothetical protein BTO04_08240 [Polaribacter sp. SA4-10]|uniref:hypothetical protein n=1 Tax=Polaribacter sp. SA4-10 TaxID=754397 RepID=UPI000B3C15A5|nr:hypothetical protein [Polaribacter sp. SA4-10]ARV06683.1 hypothetical protein BTO04_08240 [Polaribacter sp. SA4-10]